MQNSNAIVKKIYCIVINGKVEANMPFSSPEYVDKYQADKFFECATNRVFKIIPTIEGDKE